MLVGGRQVAIASICQFDKESVLERALFLNFQTDLDQYLEGHTNDCLLSNPDGLDQYRFGSGILRTGIFNHPGCD